MVMVSRLPAPICANQGPKFADGVTISAIWTETEADEMGNLKLYLQPDVYELIVKTRSKELPG